MIEWEGNVDNEIMGNWFKYAISRAFMVRFLSYSIIWQQNFSKQLITISVGKSSGSSEFREGRSWSRSQKFLEPGAGAVKNLKSSGSGAEAVNFEGKIGARWHFWAREVGEIAHYFFPLCYLGACCHPDGSRRQNNALLSLSYSTRRARESRGNTDEQRKKK